jgi:hypothetical protein
MGPGTGTLLAIGVAAFNIIATIVAVTWRLSRVELSLREAIAAEREKINFAMDRQEREFAEAMKAVREKIVQFELWSRDMFVRRDEVDAKLARMEGKIDSMGAKIDARLERMEGKIDNRLTG